MSGPAAGGKFWRRRLGWLVLIWAAGVSALGVVALLLHIMMRIVMSAGS